MAKKKATGMSKRLGFTDRQTITENKDILRYNERLEREAQGLPPEGPKGPRGRPDRPASRPPREPRPPRPPALDDEQVTSLRTAYTVVIGESGLEAAAELVLTQLADHTSFERATMAGWELASGGHAEDRTAEQWELLRAAWLSIRVALLEAYVVIKPDAQELLDRERKQQARLAKPQRQRRRPGRAPGERKPKPAAKEAATEPVRVPSPSAVARASRAIGDLPAAVADPDAPTAPAGIDQPAPDVTRDPDAPTAAEAVSEPASEASTAVEDTPAEAPAETVTVDEPEPEPEPAVAEPAVAEPDVAASALVDTAAEPVPVDEPAADAEPADVTDEVPEEHAGYVPAADPHPEPEDPDQLALEF